MAFRAVHAETAHGSSPSGAVCDFEPKNSPFLSLPGGFRSSRRLPGPSPATVPCPAVHGFLRGTRGSTARRGAGQAAVRAAEGGRGPAPAPIPHKNQAQMGTPSRAPSPLRRMCKSLSLIVRRRGGSGCRSLCLLSNGCRPHRVLRGTNPEQERHTERPEAGRIAFPASGGGGVLRPLRYFPHFSARSLPRSHLIASRVELRFPRPEVSVVVGGFSSFSFHSVGCINTGARSASPLHPDSGGFPLETAAGTGGVSSRCHWDALQPMFLLITS